VHQYTAVFHCYIAYLLPDRRPIAARRMSRLTRSGQPTPGQMHPGEVAMQLLGIGIEPQHQTNMLGPRTLVCPSLRRLSVPAGRPSLSCRWSLHLTFRPQLRSLEQVPITDETFGAGECGKPLGPVFGTARDPLGPLWSRPVGAV